MDQHPSPIGMEDDCDGPEPPFASSNGQGEVPALDRMETVAREAVLAFATGAFSPYLWSYAKATPTAVLALILELRAAKAALSDIAVKANLAASIVEAEGVRAGFAMLAETALAALAAPLPHRAAIARTGRLRDEQAPSLFSTG